MFWPHDHHCVCHHHCILICGRHSIRMCLAVSPQQANVMNSTRVLGIKGTRNRWPFLKPDFISDGQRSQKKHSAWLKLIGCKWGQSDSNAQPSDLESDALPLRHSPSNQFSYKIWLITLVECTDAVLWWDYMTECWEPWICSRSKNIVVTKIFYKIMSYFIVKLCFFRFAWQHFELNKNSIRIDRSWQKFLERTVGQCFQCLHMNAKFDFM